MELIYEYVGLMAELCILLELILGLLLGLVIGYYVCPRVVLFMFYKLFN